MHTGFVAPTEKKMNAYRFCGTYGEEDECIQVFMGKLT